MKQLFLTSPPCFVRGSHHAACGWFPTLLLVTMNESCVEAANLLQCERENVRTMSINSYVPFVHVAAGLLEPFICCPLDGTLTQKDCGNANSEAKRWAMSSIKWTRVITPVFRRRQSFWASLQLIVVRRLMIEGRREKKKEEVMREETWKETEEEISVFFSQGNKMKKKWMVQKQRRRSRQRHQWKYLKSSERKEVRN